VGRVVQWGGEGSGGGRGGLCVCGGGDGGGEGGGRRGGGGGGGENGGEWREFQSAKGREGGRERERDSDGKCFPLNTCLTAFLA